MNPTEEGIPNSSKAYPNKLFTFEEYLALEDKTDYKSEFDKGKIIEMSGGTFKHSRIAANTINAVQNELRAKKSGCQVTDSNLKVYIEALDSNVYPDIMVLCDQPVFWGERTDIITNPLVIVEVLSKSTENYDRGQKFRKYRALPSFKEYILVCQDKIEVEAWSLGQKNDWTIQTLNRLADQLSIPALEISIPLEDIYYQLNELSN